MSGKPSKTRPTIQAYHIATGGIYCPFCREENLNTPEPPVEYSGGYQQRVECTSCDAEWVNTFKLTGYISLINEEGEDIL